MVKKREKSNEVTNENAGMTPFGYYLSSLLSDRHYDNLTQFSEALHAGGRGASPQMISRYRRGAAVPFWFVGRSIEVLELDDPETDRFVALWLDTLPRGERAVMESIWNRHPSSSDTKDLEEYERLREARSVGNGEGEPPRD